MCLEVLQDTSIKQRDATWRDIYSPNNEWLAMFKLELRRAYMSEIRNSSEQRLKRNKLQSVPLNRTTPSQGGQVFKILSGPIRYYDTNSYDRTLLDCPLVTFFLSCQGGVYESSFLNGFL